MPIRVLLVFMILLYVARISAIIYPMYLYTRIDPAGGLTAISKGIEVYTTKTQEMLESSIPLAIALVVFSLFLYSIYILGGALSLFRRKEGRIILLYSLSIEMITQCILSGFGLNTIMGFVKNIFFCGLLLFLFTRSSTIQYFNNR